MKGTIDLHEKWGWGVMNHTDESIPDWIPLHPDDLNHFAEMKERFDNFEARVLSAPEVEFETIIHPKFTGRIIYAKLNTKEEPKQIKCYCGHTTYCDCSPLEEPKDVVLGSKTSLDAQMLDRFEPKQETLEEGASKWSLEEAQEFALSKFKNENLLLEGFVSLESILKVFKAGISTGHKFGAKWQAERMYSKEEVLNIQEKYNEYIQKNFNPEFSILPFKVFFEQFKKK